MNSKVNPSELLSVQDQTSIVSKHNTEIIKLQLHTRFIGYDSFQTRWFISYLFQIRTVT